MQRNTRLHPILPHRLGWLAALSWLLLGAPFTAAAASNLDVKSMLDLGWVQAQCSTLSSGSVPNVFDGSTGTSLTTQNVNPLALTLAFKEIQHFDGFSLWFGNGTNRWQVETAATQADLDGKDPNTSYRVLVPYQSDAASQWAEASMASPVAGKVLRLTLNRLAGGSQVQLCEWEIRHQLKLEQPLITNCLSYSMSWSTEPYNYYALQYSTNLAVWTSVVCSMPRTAAMTNGGVVLPGSGLAAYRLRQFPQGSSDMPFVTKNVLVINYDPILTNHGGVRLHQYMNWGDPHELTTQYLTDLTEVSSNYVRWVPTFVDVNAWPVKADGFVYDETSYLSGSFHSPDNVNYERIIQDFDLDNRVKAGEVDEVVLWGGPYFGFYESQMVGATAYWCNSPAIIHAGVPLYVIMGLNYERGGDCALESFGHRSESILSHVYGWPSGGTTILHLWDRFTKITRDAPGSAACGNVHFPPNGMSDYDYGNSTTVKCYADDWLLNYPKFKSANRMLNAAEWNYDHRLYLKWWFAHMPHKPDRYVDTGNTINNGKLNNWWGYLADFNFYTESH
jgi:hypothetical protein